MRYIDDIFFIWTHSEQELERFLKELNNFTPKLSFTHEASKNCIPFLDLKVELTDGKLETNLYMKPTDTLITCPLIFNTLSALSSLTH